MSGLKLSIIIPVYNEEGNITEICNKIDCAMRSINFKQADYEVIFIDDGSKDNTLQMLQNNKNDYPNIKIIVLKKNYGQTAAISAGFDYANGEVIIPMDGDLQNDPEDIPRLLEKLNEGYDVVSGYRINRCDSFLTRRFPSFIANKLISLISGIKLRDYGCSLKAYKKEFVKNIKLYGEMHRFIPVYTYWEGAKITEIPVSHHPRKKGKSKYGLIRIAKVLLDLITIKFLADFSQKPIYLFGGFGIINLIAAFIVGMKTLYERFIINIPGINLLPLVMLTMLFIISSLLFISFGILAEILVRIYHESQDKPVYKISKIIQ